MRLYWILCMLFLHHASIVVGSRAVKTIGFQNKLDMQEFRLPASIFPTHYNLRLQPILDETPGYTRFTAPGNVKIVINCTEATSTIKLHALDISIIEKSIVVTDLRNDQPLRVLGSEIQPEYQFLVIDLDEPLQAGAQYEIDIQFVTPVSQTRLDGMYLDSYVDPETNETRYVATTLFAAISARRCFPSFDEPQMKAVFTIELVRKEGYHSLSNKHQVATEPLEGLSGWYVDKFAPSSPMSTYLVAMIVSDMTFEEAAVLSSIAENENTTIRVYAPYYLINRGGGVYAANQTKNVLSKFESYFNSVFMFNKLYSVSLPRFHFSAMENWQLITYNDRVLLYFPGETTEQERYRITSIIAHEVVHHYFGNLVTCEWWTWIWLNEGGATYFSHLGVEMTYPEFNPWDRFVTDVYQVAMDFDSTPATHPVANEPQSLADIGGIYDDIAYQKGASLLRMMHSFLTEGVMQTAIRKYLQEKQFSNARQDDLFEIVQETAEQLGMAQPASVKEIMHTWTHLSGYPLLRVSRINSTNIIITQEKFLTEPGNNDGEMWWIPISIAVISPTPKEYLFWMSNKDNVTILSIPDTEVIVVNPRSEGYFRTLYDTDLLLDILHYSKKECAINQARKLTSAAKAKLLHDYIAFKKIGLTDLEVEVLLNEYLCLESETLIVWGTVLKHYARQLLQVYETERYRTAAYNVKLDMEKHLLPKITGAIRKMQNHMYEQGERAILYAELTFWACFIDASQPICEPYVIKKMDKWISSSTEEEEESRSPFHVDVEDTFFCIAASIKESYWERIYRYMESTNIPAAKTRIAHSLLCTTDTKLLQRIIPQFGKQLREFVESGATLKLPVKPENLPYFRSMLRLLYNEPARQLVSSFTQ